MALSWSQGKQNAPRQGYKGTRQARSTDHSNYVFQLPIFCREATTVGQALITDPRWKLIDTIVSSMIYERRGNCIVNSVLQSMRYLFSNEADGRKYECWNSPESGCMNILWFEGFSIYLRDSLFFWMQLAGFYATIGAQEFELEWSSERRVGIPLFGLCCLTYELCYDLTEDEERKECFEKFLLWKILCFDMFLSRSFSDLDLLLFIFLNLSLLMSVFVSFIKLEILI